MLVETKKSVPATERIEYRVQCDLCGAAGNQDTPSGWENFRNYDYDACRIETETGNKFPEADFCTAEVYDCCPACFEAKVKPALVALGLNPRKVRRDY